MKLQSYLSIAVLFFIVGCAVPTKTTAPTKTTSTTSKPEESTPIAVSTTTVETPEPEESTGTIDTYAIFYIAHPQGSPKTILAALRKYPQLKLTIAFPPKYFSTPENKTLINEFKTLVSSGQIEIAMSLDNEPILPLLGDLHLAGSNVPSWHVDYRWSDDIAAHVAQGSGRYQKLWGTLPAGFIPPYLALSEDVVSTLKRFRLDWVLGKPTATESVTLYDSVIVVNPKEINALNDWYEGSPEWADQQVSQIVQNLFAVIDARAWTDLKAEPAILDRLGFYFSKSDVPARTAKVWVDELLQKNIVKDATFVEKADLSAWAQTGKQKVAWGALADARRALQTYKNSGQASVTRLDAAFSEMYSAQSGPFLLALGQSEVPLSLNEKNFIATLANVYRLSNARVPAGLNSIFLKGKWEKPKTAMIENNRPFFEQAANEMTWNDASNDDLGGGRYLYPTGAYPKNSFDLNQMKLSWTDDDVEITLAVSGRFPSTTLSLQPAFDLYVDVNRLTGAGDTMLLSGRGPLAVSREAAWEYSFVVNSNEAILYSPTATGEIKKVASFPCTTSNTSYSFSVPRRYMRGEPDDWRYTLGIFSYDTSYNTKDVSPASVLVNATAHNFGGAISARQAPIYIDLLTQTMDDQRDPYTAVERGGKGTLPYVEPQ